MYRSGLTLLEQVVNALEYGLGCGNVEIIRHCLCVLNPLVSHHYEQVNEMKFKRLVLSRFVMCKSVQFNCMDSLMHGTTWPLLTISEFFPFHSSNRSSFSAEY